MQVKALITAAFFIFLSPGLNSQSDVFSKTRIFLQDGKWSKVIEGIDKEVSTASASDKELLLFQKAYALFQMEKVNESEAVLPNSKLITNSYLNTFCFTLAKSIPPKTTTLRQKKVFWLF